MNESNGTFGTWILNNAKFLLTFLSLIVGVAIGFTQLTGRVAALERMDDLRTVEVREMKDAEIGYDTQIRVLQLDATMVKTKQENILDILEEVRVDVKKLLESK